MRQDVERMARMHTGAWPRMIVAAWLLAPDMAHGAPYRRGAAPFTGRRQCLPPRAYRRALPARVREAAAGRGGTAQG